MGLETILILTVVPVRSFSARVWPAGTWKLFRLTVVQATAAATSKVKCDQNAVSHSAEVQRGAYQPLN